MKKRPLRAVFFCDLWEVRRSSFVGKNNLPKVTTHSVCRWNYNSKKIVVCQPFFCCEFTKYGKMYLYYKSYIKAKNG